MSTWLALRLPDVDRECSEELQTRYRNLCEKVDAIQKHCAQLDADKRAFLAQDAATFNPNVGRKFSTREVEILQRDLLIRHEIMTFQLDLFAELRTIKSRAWKHAEAVREEIKQKLRKIGYEEMPPGALERHPDVSSATGRVELLDRATNEKDVRAWNADAIKQITARLEQIKRSLTS